MNLALRALLSCLALAASHLVLATASPDWLHPEGQHVLAEQDASAASSPSGHQKLFEAVTGSAAESAPMTEEDGWTLLTSPDPDEMPYISARCVGDGHYDIRQKGVPNCCVCGLTQRPCNYDPATDSFSCGNGFQRHADEPIDELEMDLNGWG